MAILAAEIVEICVVFPGIFRAKVGEDMHKLASHVVDSVAWNQNWEIVREMMLSRTQDS